MLKTIINYFLNFLKEQCPRCKKYVTPITVEGTYLWTCENCGYNNS